MALVTALQFSKDSGALCVDQESWHLLRRKTFFSDCVYSLVPGDVADRFGIELIYAGVGHPSYHMEAATNAEKRIGALYRGSPPDRDDGKEPRVKDLADIVLDEFRKVHRRRISDKLHYLYGFTADDFLERKWKSGKRTHGIRQEKVLQESRSILEGKESPGYPPLAPAVEACLAGVDGEYGFSGFTMKESDGVLSFHSCAFDALGMGRYVAAASFAKLFNGKFLDTRRGGIGKATGLYQIIDAVLEAMDHSGQVGGNIRLVMLDGKGKRREERLRVLSHNPARLAIEIVRASRARLVPKERARELLMRLMDEKDAWQRIENEFFSRCETPEKLEKLLRGYKIGEEDLPLSNITSELFPAREATADSPPDGEKKVSPDDID